MLSHKKMFHHVIELSARFSWRDQGRALHLIQEYHNAGKSFILQQIGVEDTNDIGSMSKSQYEKS